MGVVISAVVTFWVGYLIYKKFKPQPVLFLGGMILMWLASILGYGQILGAVDAKTDEHTNDPSSAHNDIGGFQG